MVSLYEVAFACRLYGPLTNWDGGLRAMREVTGPLLDPYQPDHQRALFRWLNTWGCRQFKKADHGTVAGKSLIGWADRWVTRLPDPATYLTDLSDHGLGEAADAYEDLRVQLASERHFRSGQIAEVHYGPVGSAKTLFALRPRVFAPWDKAIMSGRGYGWRDYARYLRELADQLDELSSSSGVAIADLPREVGRPESTPAKIIDEYNWVVVTNQLEPPPVEDLEKWIRWARSTSNIRTASLP